MDQIRNRLSDLRRLEREQGNLGPLRMFWNDEEETKLKEWLKLWPIPHKRDYSSIMIVLNKDLK